VLADDQAPDISTQNYHGHYEKNPNKDETVLEHTLEILLENPARLQAWREFLKYCAERGVSMHESVREVWDGMVHRFEEKTRKEEEEKIIRQELRKRKPERAEIVLLRSEALAVIEVQDKLATKRRKEQELQGKELAAQQRKALAVRKSRSITTKSVINAKNAQQSTLRQDKLRNRKPQSEKLASTSTVSNTMSTLQSKAQLTPVMILGSLFTEFPSEAGKLLCFSSTDNRWSESIFHLSDGYGFLMYIKGDS
jgi:hypothetical protein